MTESLEQEIQTLRSLFWSERDPDGRGFVPLADAYRRAGDVRQAMDLLTDGLARHPEFAPAHVVAARLYVEQGMVEEGEMAARRALDLDAENVYALDALLRVLEERGRGEEAAEVRDRLLAVDPGALDGGEVGALDGGEAEVPSIDASVEGASEEASLAASEEPGSGLIDISDMTDFTFSEQEEAPEAEHADEAAEDEPAVSDFGLVGITISDGSEQVEDESTDPNEGAEAEGPADAVEISALAPDPEPDDFVEIAVLAPEADEPADVVEISALAPDPEPADVVDIAALAPDPEPADVVDISTLAPDAAAYADVVDLSERAPDEPVGASAASLAYDAPAGPEARGRVVPPPSSGAPDDDDSGQGEEGGAPIYTRTLAELYIKQGFTDRALEVLRHLQRGAPGDESLARRIEELEAGQGTVPESVSRAAAPRRLPGGPEAAALVRASEEGEAAGHEAEEEVEALARDLAESGDRGHDVDTPFAWTEQEVEESAEEHQSSIREYFEGLLTWRSREGS